MKFLTADIFTGHCYFFSFLKVLLPGMTERSLTPSATAFGLSEVALEGWKKKHTKLKSLTTTIHIFTLSQCLKQKFLKMLGVLFFLPFVAAQFVRGNFSTHFAIELGAEEGHAEAEFQRDPLIFRWNSWKERKGGDNTYYNIFVTIYPPLYHLYHLSQLSKIVLSKVAWRYSNENKI